MWNFGSWKTMSTFLEAFSKDKRSTYIISNVPYSCVDHFYSTVDDLLNVFEVLDDYTMRTNLDIKSYSGVEKYTKSILLIIDEAHLYLGARESLTKASILNKLKLIFTQCRKRKIRIVFITQRLTQIDIYVRRLADYVEEYHRSNFLWLYRVKKTVYENRWDVADIETDTSIKMTNDGQMKNYKEDAKLYSEFFRPLTMGLQLFSFTKKGYRDLIKEYHNTYYVCWQHDDRVSPLTFEKLVEWLSIPIPPILSLQDKLQNNVPTFYKIYQKVVVLSDKIHDKVCAFLDTQSKTLNSENLPFSKDDKILVEVENKAFIKWRLEDDEEERKVKIENIIKEKRFHELEIRRPLYYVSNKLTQFLDLEREYQFQLTLDTQRDINYILARKYELEHEDNNSEEYFMNTSEESLIDVQDSEDWKESMSQNPNKKTAVIKELTLKEKIALLNNDW